MNIYFKYILIALIVLLTSCNKQDKTVDLIEETQIDLQMISTYKAGIKELERGDALIAAKKFNEAEILYPQSKWAPRSALMAAYAYYTQNYFDDSIYELERFIKTYKNHEREDYTYYLMAISYYDQIADEKKDLKTIIKAKENFEIVVDKFPNTDFALDSEYKLDLIQDILASKEMYIARYYVEREKWIPAINRFKIILEDYDTTIFAEEALHRLVEIHYKIGLVEESKKYASILGYNYQSSEWYKKSYKIFNQDYSKRIKSNKKNKKSILKKFKTLIN